MDGPKTLASLPEVEFHVRSTPRSHSPIDWFSHVWLGLVTVLTIWGFSYPEPTLEATMLSGFFWVGLGLLWIVRLWLRFRRPERRRAWLHLLVEPLAVLAVYALLS